VVVVERQVQRTISELTTTIHRAGLMGTMIKSLTPSPPQPKNNELNDVKNTSSSSSSLSRWLWKEADDDDNDDDNGNRETSIGKQMIQTNSDSSISNVILPPPLPQPVQGQPHRGRQKQRRAQSVLEELQNIRQWHLQHGFYGGIVVRDITKLLEQQQHLDDSPSKPPNSSATVATDTEKEDDDDNDVNIIKYNQSPTTTAYYYNYMKHIWNRWQIYVQQQRIARRECYYIYYEICPITGQVTQQIFIRGTTLWIDIVTCILAYMVYDPEIQCHAHYGFLQHTHRILQDIIPLLSKDAKIELCGHSLGGAVASLLAMKLHLRGYHITKLTTIGEPAYLWFQDETLWNSIRSMIPKAITQQAVISSDSDPSTTTTTTTTIPQRRQIQLLLPNDHIRIEHDCDIVPYLPPFGSHIGNKIWITKYPNHHTTDNVVHSINQPQSIPKISNVYWVNHSSGTSSYNSPTTTTTNDHHTTTMTTTRNIFFHSDNPYWWTESVWINCYIPELYYDHRQCHRISNYIDSLQNIG
jgi:hypothetical protein